MKIAVVGGGLVGRLAAWAAMQAGHSPTIFDRVPNAVTPRGFVYLHDPCGLPLRLERIHVVEQGGTNVDYSIKVYGGHTTPTDVSFGKFSGLQEGYAPGELLAILNGLQHHMVEERLFREFGDVLALRDVYDRIVFTLPIDQFITGTWPSRRGSVGVFKLDDGEVLENFCVYNANFDIPWHRAGHMFGYAFYEYPVEVQGHQSIVKVRPGGDDPPSWEHILFTGRFGAWRKDQLSHDSYYEVLDWLV